MTRPSAVRPDWRDVDDVRRALVESCTDAILAADLEGSIAMANERSAELFGFAAPDELLGLSLSGLLPDTEGESVRAGTARLPVEVHTSTMRDTAGRPTGTLCVIRDVSELERLRGEHQAIFEATGDGMVVYTVDGTIVAANPAFCEMNGYACEELVGRNVSLLVHPDKHDLLRELIQTIASGGTLRARATNVRKDGSTFPVEVHGTVFEDESGPLILGVARDVTEQVQAVELLEQRVAERTSELFTLLDVAHNVASVLELEPLLKVILDQLQGVLDCRRAILFTIEKDYLVVRAVAAEDRPIILPPESLDGDASLPPLAIPLDSLGAVWDRVRSGEAGIVAAIQGDDPLARDYRAAVAKYGLPYNGERSWMMVPMVMRGRTVGVILVFHDQPNVYTADHARLARAVADQAAVAIENARLYELETERTKELRAVLAIAHNVASVLEIEPLLNLILDELKVVTEYGGASLMRFEGDDLVMLAGAFGTKAATGPWVYPLTTMGPAWAWEVLRRGETILINDVYSEEPLSRAYQEVMRNHPELEFPGAHAWMAVPLVIHERAIGAISLLHPQAGYYTAHHAQLAQAIAAQAAVAMENARLYEQAQQTAVLEERQRLARELHDAVTQTLFSASLIAEILPRLWERDPEAGMRRLEDVRALTRGALAEMRTLLLELRPAAIVQAELGDLLRQLAEILTGRSRLPVSVTVKGEGALPPDVQLALYRVAQEALHNIEKHAKASQVEVRLVRSAGAVELYVGDDGCGFDPAAAGDAGLAHFGMSIMRDRAKAVGATFTVRSEPGSGTEVVMRWSDGQGG